MLHHISIPVDNPLHVAKVLAEIQHGHVLPFAACPGSYIVLADDEYGTAIELVPSGTEMIPGQEKVEYEHNVNYSQFSAIHIAISVSMNQHEIEHIAAREGWHVALGNRGQFKLIEFWVENKLLLEIMPPPTVPKYIKSMTPQSFIILIFVMNILRKYKKVISNFQKKISGVQSFAR